MILRYVPVYLFQSISRENRLQERRAGATDQIEGEDSFDPYSYFFIKKYDHRSWTGAFLQWRNTASQQIKTFLSVSPSAPGQPPARTAAATKKPRNTKCSFR